MLPTTRKLHLILIPQKWLSAGLAGLLAVSSSVASAGDMPLPKARPRPQPKTVAECLEVKKDGGNGIMPKGVTDQKLEEYKNSQRCVASDGKPIDEDTCRIAVENLYEVAKALNMRVKEGCKWWFDSKTPEVENCAKAYQQKFSGGEDNTQTACTQKANEVLGQAKVKMHEFRANLRDFFDKLNTVQQLGIEVSGRVVGTIEETASSRGTPVFEQPSHPTAGQYGVSTLSEVDDLNGRQDPKVAASLLREIKGQFEKADYTAADQANYGYYSHPIEDAMGKLDQNIKSPILKGQLSNYLDAQEIKLAARLQENELSEIEKQMSEFEAKNTRNVDQLGAASPETSLASMPSTSENSRTNMGGLTPPALALPGSGGNGAGVSNESPLALQSAGGYGSAAAGARAAEKRKILVDSGKGTETADAGLLAGSATGASRMPDAGKRLRDALKKKLAEKNAGRKGGRTTASTSEAGSLGEKSEKILKELGGEGEGQRILSGAFGSLEEQALASFGGELAGERIGVGGSSTDAAVKTMIRELEKHSQGEAETASYIGDTNGPSLFDRVKDFHERCLKRGCVAGLTRGKL